MNTQHNVFPLYLAIVICVLTIYSAFAAQDFSHALNSAEKAMQSTALWLTGNRSDPAISTASVLDSTTIAMHTDSTTAFLQRDLDGRVAWKVPVADLTPAIANDSGWAASKDVRSGTILLDSLTGQFLKCYVRRTGVAEPTFRLPSVDEAERQLRSFRNRYHGLPDSKPRVSQLEALRKCKAYALAASEITVQYLLYTNSLQEAPIAAWVIYFRGGFQLPLSSPDASAASRSTWRIVIDAMSGDVVNEDNFPQPEGK